MKNSRSLAFALCFSIICFGFLPTFLQTLNENPSSAPIELQLQLVFEATGTDSTTLQLSYTWISSGPEEQSYSTQLRWYSTKAAAEGDVANLIQQEIKASFNEIDILFTPFHGDADGSWQISISKRVHQHVTLGVSAVGYNGTIQDLNIDANLNLFPSNLKTVLAGLGVRRLAITGTVRLRIQSDFWQRYWSNFGLNYQSALNLIQDFTETLLGVVLIT